MKLVASFSKINKYFWNLIFHSFQCFIILPNKYFRSRNDPRLTGCTISIASIKISTWTISCKSTWRFTGDKPNVKRENWQTKGCEWKWSESVGEDGVIEEERRDSERTFSSLPMKMDGSPPSLSPCCWEVIDGLQESKVTETKVLLPLCALCVSSPSVKVFGRDSGRGRVLIWTLTATHTPVPTQAWRDPSIIAVKHGGRAWVCVCVGLAIYCYMDMLIALAPTMPVGSGGYHWTINLHPHSCSITPYFPLS